MKDGLSEINIDQEVAKLIHTYPDSTSLTSLWSDALKSFNNKEYDQSLSIFEDFSEEIDKVTGSGKSLYKAHSLKWAANCAWMLSDFDLALDHIEEAIKVYQDVIVSDSQKAFLSEAYEIKGITHLEKNQYQEAVEAFQNAIDSTIDSEYRKGWLFFHLGISKEYLMLNTEATECYQNYKKALEGCKDVPSMEGELLFVNGVIARLNDNNMEVAKDFLKQAFDFFYSKQMHYFVTEVGKFVGNFFNVEGEFDLAVKYYENTLESLNARFGEEHFRTNSILDWIGFICYNNGDYKKSVDYHTRIINNISKRYKGETLAVFYLHAGAAYLEVGQHEKSIEMYEAAKEIYGEEHDTISLIYCYLGNVYWDISKYDKALEYYLKSYEKDVATYGENDPYMASLNCNIGNVYWKKAQYEKSLEYINKAEQIYLNIFGPDHFELNSVYTIKAHIAIDKGDYDGAVNLYSSSLKLTEKTYGPDHPQTANDYFNLAKALERKGGYSKAIEYIDKAYKIDIKVQGENHPNVGRDFSLMGWIFSRQGNPKQSVELHQKAIKILENQEQQPKNDIGIAYYRLAFSYIKLKEYDLASLAAQKALEIRLGLFGEAHPDTAACYYHLGLIAKGKNNYDEALSHLMRALNIRKTFFDSNHPDIVENEGEIEEVKAKLKNR